MNWFTPVQLVTGICCLVVMDLTPPTPARPADARPDPAHTVSPRAETALMHFLEHDEEPIRSYVGTRKLTVRTEHFGQEAWMNVRTTFDTRGFRYEVTGEGGSAFMRRRVLKAMLDEERAHVARAEAKRAALTTDNYEVFVAADEGHVVRLTLLPRREEVFLLDGEARVHADTGELISVSGRLAKNPSFWTTRVDVMRNYARVGGVRLPVALESIASVRVVGRSILKVAFEYTSVNGRPAASTPDGSAARG